MKKCILHAAAVLSALCTAVSLCGCDRSENVPEITSAESSASYESKVTTISQTSISESEISETVSTIPNIPETSASVSETSVFETSLSETTVSETLPPETQTEIITEESSYSEEIATVLSETVSVSSAVASSSEETTVLSAPVVIPEIYCGSFSGEKVLENELARIDISDAANGVIKITYSGKCEKLKVRITKDGSIYDYTLDRNGTVYPLQSGSGEYNVKVLENVSGKTYAIALDETFSASISDEFRPFLMPTQYISFKNGDKCVEKAAVLCAGCKSDFEKVSAIFKYVTDNIAYDTQLAASVKSGYIPDPDETLEKGSGICFDYASLFAAMCRTQSIPARLVMGYVKGDVYHAWNEVYTNETGWVTVDLFLDSKGWELLDPTFYASADNKSSAAEYMSDKNGYSAVYYY